MQSISLNQPHPSEPYEDDQLQLMTANLLKIRRELTERDDQPTPSPPKPLSATRTSQLSDQLLVAYQQYLRTAALPPSHEQKLQYLLEEQEIGVGTCVALFEMLYYFRRVVEEGVLGEVAARVGDRLVGLGAKATQAQRCCMVELLAVCGVWDEGVAGWLVEEMLEGRLELGLGFGYLSNVGYRGLEVLVNLAKEDFKDMPVLILDHLSRNDQVLTQLLIPALVEDLSNAKTKGRQKDILLSILNRLNQSVSSHPQLMAILHDMMVNNYNDRGFVASVLRSSGPEGEKLLLQLMHQYFQNQKIMLPIVSVLPWRVKSEPELRIKVIEYTLGSNFMPGTLYQYEGNIEPSAFCFEDENCCDSLCLNARDFIAALNRMLAIKQQNFEQEETTRRGPLNNARQFTLFEVISKQSEEQKSQISMEVIKSLTRCLQNPKPQIRQAAINSIGLIGLPEAYETIDQVTKCLWDPDSRNRSMACWALSRICQSTSKKLTGRLIELLKDKFWKVRISACICIGALVKEPSQQVIQALVRCLKDSSINKVTVCEAIIKMGIIGEQILLQILKNTGQNDFKLREAVIYSLREADVKNPHIDFVLEEIFKHCKGTRVETRVNCLQTLNCLRIRASEEGECIVYLKAKTILPFYYYFLEDQSLKIRQMATEAIYSFGGQAELIFIEGITRGSQMVRIESAKGLAKLGIQNFRALILGLRDEDDSVRKVTSGVILSSFSPADVAAYYSGKPQQLPSLLCNLKDILSSGGLPPSMRTFVKETIANLQSPEENVAKEMDLNKECKSIYLSEGARKSSGLKFL